MIRSLRRTLIAVSLLSAFCGAQQYKQVGKYPLPGEGFWDYLTFDTAGNRLFVAHGSSILVVDPEGKKLGEIPADGAHGIALVPEENLGFSSNGHANTVTVFDLKTLKPIQQIATGEGPDAVIYDPYSKHVIVMNGHGKSISVIDPATKQVVATVPLGGKLEFAAALPGTVFVNVEDRGELAAIDSTSWKQTNRWKLEGCEEPGALAADQKNAILFDGCGNAKMLIIEAKTGKVLQTLPTGDGTDAAGFDPGLGNAFTSNGSGTLTVVHKNDGAWGVVENVPTMKSARTMAVDPNSHKVFTVGAEFNPPPPGERRGTMKPGTFTLLVFAPSK